MRTVTTLALSIVLASQSPFGLTAEPAPVPIVVLDFDYVDTSGEPREQSAFHRAQLESLVQSLKSDLERSAAFRVVSKQCEPTPCARAGSEPVELVAAARSAGARLLLFGAIHKASTLVQWASVQVVDVQTERVIFNRLMSFRGDDARAWQRAEAFLAKDIVAQSWPHG